MEGYLRVLLAVAGLTSVRAGAILHEKVCDLRVTSHSSSHNRPRTDQSPYHITTAHTKYIPGRPTQVSIVNKRPFKGFVLQARHVGTPDVVGQFKDVPSWVILSNCQGSNNTIYAWFDSPRIMYNVTFTWVSPEIDQGTVHFLGTVYEDEANFWTNLQSKRFREGFAAIDLQKCGSKKTCFRYIQPGQSTCTQETCTYLVTSRVEGSTAHFEISAMAEWAAIGFSSDDRMGGDDVFMCMRSRTSGEVKHYWNDYAYQPPHLQEDNPLFNHQVEVSEDGRIACRFSRLLKVTNGNQFNIDLNNDWYQLYAWGPLTQTGTLMRHVLDNPSVSAGKITLLRKTDVISHASSSRMSGQLLPLAAALWVILPYLLPST